MGLSFYSRSTIILANWSRVWHGNWYYWRRSKSRFQKFPKKFSKQFSEKFSKNFQKNSKKIFIFLRYEIEILIKYSTWWWHIFAFKCRQSVLHVRQYNCITKTCSKTWCTPSLPHPKGQSSILAWYKIFIPHRPFQWNRIWIMIN